MDQPQNIFPTQNRKCRIFLQLAKSYNTPLDAKYHPHHSFWAYVIFLSLLTEGVNGETAAVFNTTDGLYSF